MDNWKLYALAGFNRAYETFERGLILSGLLFNSFCNYLNGTSNEWYFIENGVTLPASSFHSRPSNSSLQWVYNVYQNTLVPGSYRLDEGGKRLKWLSTTINIDATEYVIDDFMKQFLYVPDETHVLDANILASCYYIYSKHWPVTDRDVTLNIIDSNGDEHAIVLDGTLDVANQVEWDGLFEESDATEEDEEEEEEEVATEAAAEAATEVATEAAAEVATEAATEAAAEAAAPSSNDQEDTTEICPDNKIEPKQATEIVC